jgi:hypothetical protein
MYWPNIAMDQPIAFAGSAFGTPEPGGSVRESRMRLITKGDLFLYGTDRIFVGVCFDHHESGV